MRTILGCLLFTALFSCKSPSDPNKPHVLIRTQAGDIEVELYPLQAPRTVAAFLSYVDSGLYKNGSFYRVLNEDNQPSGSGAVKMIQGGIWQTNHARAASLPGVPDEPTNQTHISHTEGVISLARTGPGTATTEFFICLDNEPGYDYKGENSPDSLGYTAFGKVVKGMEVVRAIYGDPQSNQIFTPPIPVADITRN